MAKQTQKITYLKDYQPSNYLIDTVNLSFNLDDAHTTVRAEVELYKNPAVKAADNTLELAGEELQLNDIKIDNKQLSNNDYTVDAEKLVIAKVPDKFTLSLETIIKPQDNTALSGLYLSNGNYCTQCESHGFRRIIYFLDRPDVMCKFTTTIEADKTRFPVLLSNGNLIDQQDVNSERHKVTWQDPFKKPAYLFALVAGNLEYRQDHFTTQSGRKVDLRIYVEPGKVSRTAHAMQCLQQSMRWDEQTFGREYDLDIFNIVAVSDFNMGAMENKSLNIFNDKYILVDPVTATDQDYDNVITVVGHEYFHNWTGNRVTLRDWFQLSLKEGLTVFREQQFKGDMTSHAVGRIDNVNNLRITQFAEDGGPMSHPVRPASYIEINNFYTATVYSKGAEVVRMINTILGQQGFRKGMDLYFQRHDGQAVTCDDFVKAMEDANNIDLGQFKRWYSQSGTPQLTLTTQYDEQQQIYTVTVKQTCLPTADQTDKQDLHIPLAVSLFTAEGKQLTDTSQVLAVTQASQQFKFENIKQRPIISVLRDFSAPVKVIHEVDINDLVTLMIHDTDGFNQWETAQRLALKIMLPLINDYQQGKSLTLNPAFIKAYAQVLAKTYSDESLRARVLSLPNQRYLGEWMEVIDVDAIYHVHRFVREQLASQLQTQWQAIYDEYHQSAAYEYNQQAVGQRSMKNLCLSYLRLLNSDESRQRCQQQFNTANNMTDKIAALATLSHIDHPARITALETFYEQHHQQPLVLNKWLSIQASSELPDTLRTVEKLLHDPVFDITNPNKVYALIGVFCHNNQVHFHQRDGAGYAFLADRVLELDKLNPQVAARMVSPLIRWRDYDEQRQQLMQQQLERILQLPTLSKDVYELVHKGMNGNIKHK